MTYYKYTHEEFMETLKLKPSEKDVLYYLRTLTPFGDRPINMSIRGIARTLSEGKGQEVSPSTVSRALKELDRLGLIEMELLKVSVTVNPFSKENTSKEVLSPRNTRCVDATPVVSTQHPLSPRNSRRSKAAASKDSEASQTIQTIQTNTKRERAAILKIFETDIEFKNFCYRKANELPDRPVLVESWITSNFKELESLYKSKSSPVGKSSAAVKISQAAPESPPESPKVAIALALGEITQDPVFPDGIFDLEGNWHKKIDWEAMQNDGNHSRN